jgi:hypothetical protein
MVVKMRSIVVAAAVISGFAVSGNLFAQCASSVISYQASGAFGSTVLSGLDEYELAGEPFSITIYACESKKPVKTSSDSSTYTGLVLTGSVKSRLLTTPYPINTDKTTFTLVQPATGLDSIQLSGTVVIKGATIAIKGNVALPPGTLTSASIAPFPSVSIYTARSEFTYTWPAWKPSNLYGVNQRVLDPSGNAQEVTTAGTSGTTAPVWNETLGGTTTDGSVVWTCKGSYLPTSLAMLGTAAGTVYTGAGAKASLLLHSDGVQVITAHTDGTHSVRAMRAAPVDPAASSDTTMLQFYASGVRDASEVHVQIAGQEVPLLYSGAAGHFPGLDEVTVEIPRTMAGMGDVDVVLTADGQAANPVRIHIQ